ncbi:NAD(P)/FAD-dependent oxidoreductase [Agromyces salentinus]|uniref:FAD/NAD(P)-binding oxidoreductase n=1 Tax=Agromyces salentinus TaxID=269421 RepID=A0ABN2MEN6_9MICO|nr:FAD/NAD(P)-binding oxidoreductase [Agromyces salentinus]
MTHHRIVIIGGGNAGLSVAGRLQRKGIDDVVVIEPRGQHRFQPLFSHVAGGVARASMAVRPQASVMPEGVGWLQETVMDLEPDADAVVLASGARVTYDQLIVCPGMQLDWDAVPGLTAALGTPSVASHYEFDLVPKASRLLRDLRSGTVVFTQPPGPAKCAGASQKPMYLACDYWRATGVLGDIRVVMVVPDPTIFGIPEIDRELERKIAEYGIEVRYGIELRSVDGANNTVEIGPVSGGPGAGAGFSAGSGSGSVEQLHYDVLNVVPPQSAPDWLKSTSLPAAGDSGGFVEVDPETLRHVRYDNVWALGDAAATRNSKSGGALRKQTKVVAENVLTLLDGREPATRYDGYTVCPFTVSRSTVVFAEFDDAYRLKPTIPFWTSLSRERRLSWLFDRHILPWVYWHMILKGRA